MINSLGIKVLAWVNRFSVALHSCGVFSICVALLVKAPTHRSAKQVFDTFNDSTGDPGWSVKASPAYVALTGILLAQFTITGELSNFSRTRPVAHVGWLRSADRAHSCALNPDRCLLVSRVRCECAHGGRDTRCGQGRPKGCHHVRTTFELRA